MDFVVSLHLGMLTFFSMKKTQIQYFLSAEGTPKHSVVLFALINKY